MNVGFTLDLIYEQHRNQTHKNPCLFFAEIIGTVEGTKYLIRHLRLPFK